MANHEQVEPQPIAPKKPRRITGWLSTLSVPETHAEFRKARREASAKLSQAITDKAKRK